MSAEAAFTRTWSVGARRATLSAPRRLTDPAQLLIEWEPSRPDRLSADELSEYRRGRDAALAELAHELGASIAVVDFRGTA